MNMHKEKKRREERKESAIVRLSLFCIFSNSGNKKLAPTQTSSLTNQLEHK
jgi:hypothetical protein